jgi:hypothetical protein
MCLQIMVFCSKNGSHRTNTEEYLKYLGPRFDPGILLMQRNYAVQLRNNAVCVGEPDFRKDEIV